MGNNICYYTFIILFPQKQLTPRKVKCLFMNFFKKYECIRSCYLPTSSNLLKKSFRKTSLFVLAKIAVIEKVLSQLDISSYYCNVVIKILEKYLLRRSVLEMNFQKLFVGILIQDFNHKFQKTFSEVPLAVSDLCSILYIIDLVHIDCTVLFRRI